MSGWAVVGYALSNVILFSCLLYVIYNNVRMVNNLGSFIKKLDKDGTHFCKNCNHVVGFRRSGEDILDTNFVYRRDSLELPDNVIPFKNKETKTYNEDDFN